MRRVAWVGMLVGLVAAGVAAMPHDARAWWRGGIGVGVWVPPLVAAPPIYPPPIYYAPPVYAPPPVGYVAPPPAWYSPQHHVWIPPHWQGPYWVRGHWS